MPEGDARAGRLAMRLKVEQQNRKAFGMEQARSPQHREPVGMHTMQQHHCADAGLARDEPATQCRARVRRDRNRLDGNIRRRGADDGGRGCGEKQPDRNDGGDQKDCA